MDDEVRPAPRSKARYTGQVRLCTARYRCGYGVFFSCWMIKDKSFDAV